MIGNPKWFELRKFGWGVKPKAWQGWTYVCFAVLPFIFFAFPLLSIQIRLSLSALWILLLSIDALDIMIHIKKDEREYLHEALVERNVAWFLVTFLALALVYKLLTSAQSDLPAVDPLFAIALLGGALMKLTSYVYYRNK